MTSSGKPIGADQLYLRTLGTCALHQVAVDGTTTTLLESSKLLALLTYLNAAPARSATRDHLVNLLWSDRDEEGGRKALRQHLWLLGDRFGNAITVDRASETVRLRETIRCDRDEVRDASAAGDLVKVVSLYRGEFFPEFAASGAQDFEHWIDRERTALRLIFVQSAQLVVRGWLDQGRSRDAAALARRLRDADPFDQAGWRVLLETLIAGRDLIGASVEVDAMQRFALEEGLEPDATTLAVFASVRSPGAANIRTGESQTLVAATELVGREAEFAILLRRWDLAVKGRTQLVRLTGPAGIGKTRLMQEFAARLRASRFAVEPLRAKWSIRNLPFAFLSDLISEVVKKRGASAVSPRSAGVLVGLAPSASAVLQSAVTLRDRGDELVERVAAIRELLDAVCFERPLCLLLDDMHWCDAASRQAFLAAIDGMDRSNLLVVMADRDFANGDFPQSTLTVPLGSLSPQAVTALVASIAELPDLPWASELGSALATASDGSPLHVLETLQLAVQQGALSLSDAAWSCSDSSRLFEILRGGGAVRARLLALGPRERRAVLALALIGVPVSAELLAECLAEDLDTCARLLDELERSGVLSRSAAGFLIYHDQIAETARLILPDLAVERRVGVVLADRASTAVEMVTAASLLTDAQSGQNRATLFRRFVSLHRRSGDRRPARAFVPAFLGQSSSAADVRELVSGLAPVQRVGLDIPGRAALAMGAGAALLSVVGWLSFNKPTPVPAAIITAFRYDTTGYLVGDEFGLPQGWEQARGSLNIRNRGRPFQIKLAGVERVVSPPHDSLPLLIVRQVDDTLLTDLFEYRKDGSIRQLTHANGDDTSPSWSPDGSSIAFSTARWDSTGKRDVAILDRRTGAVRRITRGTEADGVEWSPKGDKLAWRGARVNGQGSGLCVVEISAPVPRCHSFGTKPLRLRGWIGNDALLVSADNPEGLLRLDIATGDTIRIRIGSGAVMQFDEDGSVLCHCLDESRTTYHWALLRDYRDPVSLIMKADSPQRFPYLYMAVRFAAPSEGIAPLGLPKRVVVQEGIPTQLPAEGRSAKGEYVDASLIKWHANDTTAIRATGDGQLIGLRVGTRTTVVAELDGWRTDSTVVIVVPPINQELHNEGWRPGWSDRWRLFGEPQPEVTTHEDGTPALSNRGDGRFNSGAYSQATYASADGLALRVRLAGRVTRGEWQVQQLELRADIRTEQLARWDHRTGYLWSEGRQDHVRSPACELRYPGGPEGAGTERWLRIGNDVVAADATKLANGGWFDVILQWLPDGRCAYVLNGELVAVSASRARSDSVRVILFGNSVGTSMLVGPLSVFRGVSPDVARLLRESAR